MNSTIKEMIELNRAKLNDIIGEYENLKEMAVKNFAKTLEENPNKIWPSLVAISKETGLSEECWSSIVKRGYYYKNPCANAGLSFDRIRVPIKKISKPVIRRTVDLDECGNIIPETITTKTTYIKGYGYDG